MSRSRTNWAARAVLALVLAGCAAERDRLEEELAQTRQTQSDLYIRSLDEPRDRRRLNHPDAAFAARGLADANRRAQDLTHRLKELDQR